MGRQIVAHPEPSGFRPGGAPPSAGLPASLDRKSTRLNSSHSQISYAAFCLKKKNHRVTEDTEEETQRTPLNPVVVGSPDPTSFGTFGQPKWHGPETVPQQRISSPVPSVNLW